MADPMRNCATIAHVKSAGIMNILKKKIIKTSSPFSFLFFSPFFPLVLFCLVKAQNLMKIKAKGKKSLKARQLLFNWCCLHLDYMLSFLLGCCNKIQQQVKWMQRRTSGWLGALDLKQFLFCYSVLYFVGCSLLPSIPLYCLAFALKVYTLYQLFLVSEENNSKERNYCSNCKPLAHS